MLTRSVTPRLLKSCAHGYGLLLSRRLSSRAPVSAVLPDTTDLKKLDLQEEVKSILRQIPHGLTIITASSDSSNNHSREGLLVSSFNSVTISPEPYVSFNIRSPSSTLSAIQSCHEFTASLVDSPSTAEVFALEKDREQWRTMLDAYGRVRKEHGCIGWMRCEWDAQKSIRVGDHLIIVGKVLDTGRDMQRSNTSALVHWQGTYEVLASS